VLDPSSFCAIVLISVSTRPVRIGDDIIVAVCTPGSPVSTPRPVFRKGRCGMDKDRIKGTVKQAEGTIKEKVGQATGDTPLEIEGKVEKAEGTVQKAFGKVKDALRKG
jgi:uncharacterized protein YjbJ (UPF0337 family)